MKNLGLIALIFLGSIQEAFSGDLEQRFKEDFADTAPTLTIPSADISTPAATPSNPEPNAPTAATPEPDAAPGLDAAPVAAPLPRLRPGRNAISTPEQSDKPAQGQ